MAILLPELCLTNQSLCNLYCYYNDSSIETTYMNFEDAFKTVQSMAELSLGLCHGGLNETSCAKGQLKML